MCSENNICFMCANDTNCIIVDDKIITEVEYVLPEITVTKMDILLRICSLCNEKLHLFHEFKESSLENSQRLEVKIKNEQCNTYDTIQLIGDCSEKNSALDGENKKIEEIFIKEEPGDDSSDGYFDGNEEEIDSFEVNSHNSQEYIDTKDVQNFVNESSDTPQCPLCNKLFTSLKTLKIHLKTHNGKRKYECSLCNKTFTQNVNLKNHKKIHTGVKDYICHICNKSFTESSNLRKHLKIHNNIKDQQCTVCNRSFIQSSNLKRHMQTHTGNRVFICSVCNKTYTRKDGLKLHMRRHTGTIVRKFNCSRCDKSFPSNSALNRHMKTHS